MRLTFEGLKASLIGSGVPVRLWPDAVETCGVHYSLQKGVQLRLNEAPRQPFGILGFAVLSSEIRDRDKVAPRTTLCVPRIRSQHTSWFEDRVHILKGHEVAFHHGALPRCNLVKASPHGLREVCGESSTADYDIVVDVAAYGLTIRASDGTCSSTNAG